MPPWNPGYAIPEVPDRLRPVRFRSRDFMRMRMSIPMICPTGKIPLTAPECNQTYRGDGMMMQDTASGYGQKFQIPAPAGDTATHGCEMTRAGRSACATGSIRRNAAGYCVPTAFSLSRYARKSTEQSGVANAGSKIPLNSTVFPPQTALKFRAACRRWRWPWTCHWRSRCCATR